MLCFSLYTATHATAQAHHAVLRPWKLTYPQFIVLTLLNADDDRSVRDIGDEMHLDSGTLSPLLKRLEARDLVERRRDPDDDRVVRVRLTPAGRSTIGDAARAVAELTPAYRVDAASLPDIVQMLHGITAGMGELVETRR
jgi:DNA-binding MarR family transcriptional regulator